MRRRCGQSGGKHRRGLTLVEAVVGLGLLTAVLVSLLTANTRAKRQAHNAELRITACEIADELLIAWQLDRANFPRAGSGPIADHPGWTWRTQTVFNAEASELDGEVVALEILPPDRNQPAASVEVVLPIRTPTDA